MIEVDQVPAFRARMKSFPIIRGRLCGGVEVDVVKRDLLRNLADAQHVAWVNRGDIITVIKIGSKAECEEAY